MLNPESTWHFGHHRGHGPRLLPDGTTNFRLWAPAQPQMRLEVGSPANQYLMEPDSDGWHAVTVRDLGAGTRYWFVLPNGKRVPDPASHYQPDDLCGMSELIDPISYRWRDYDWAGRPWYTAVLYEVHVGTFTPQGTFLGIVERLDHLVSLGVTAIELMPVGAFPGRRSWGYDGVFPNACARTYGHPDDLKYLVDAAHARGLMILLDVVYNHFGPEGNLLSLYAPQFFSERHQAPWGPAINFDGAHSTPVREFFIGNAIRWIEEFHFDGLRLDAAHAIADDSPRHFLDELADRVRECAPDQTVHRDKPEHSQWLAWYRQVLAVRRAEISPRLKSLTGGEGCYFIRGPQAVTVQWLCRGGTFLRLNANLSDVLAANFPVSQGREIWLEGGIDERGALRPWTVQWLVIA
jgi:maltooligosyltrehalose trehalohydrolase